MRGGKAPCDGPDRGAAAGRRGPPSRPLRRRAPAAARCITAARTATGLMLTPATTVTTRAAETTITAMEMKITPMGAASQARRMRARDAATEAWITVTKTAAATAMTTGATIMGRVAWRYRAAFPWLTGAMTVTACGWISCICRWARFCRTGLPG